MTNPYFLHNHLSDSGRIARRVFRWSSISHHEFVVVLHEFQRGGHFLIRQAPVAVQVVEVVRAFLQKDPQRLHFGLADDRRIDVPAADVGENCRYDSALCGTNRPFQATVHAQMPPELIPHTAR